jgi:hypothetical protein
MVHKYNVGNAELFDVEKIVLNSILQMYEEVSKKE